MKSFLLYNETQLIEMCGTNATIMFETNATRFTLEYAVSNIIDGNYPHVGITAREGLAVLYRKRTGNGYSCWYPVDLLSKVYKAEVNMTHMIKENEIYEVLIYGPILAHLSKLTCVLNGEDYFRIPKHCARRKCLILGGNKTFGIGVTSTSMIFGNILQREMTNRVYFTRIACEKYNYLPFIASQVEKMDISQFDGVILEADAYRQEKDIVEIQLPFLINMLAQKVEHVICWHAIPPVATKKSEEIAAVISKQNRNNVSCLNCDNLFESPHAADMYTYSVNFINDTGNINIFQNLEQRLEKLWNI